MLRVAGLPPFAAGARPSQAAQAPPRPSILSLDRQPRKLFLVLTATDSFPSHLAEHPCTLKDYALFAGDSPTTLKPVKHGALRPDAKAERVDVAWREADEDGGRARVVRFVKCVLDGLPSHSPCARALGWRGLLRIPRGASAAPTLTAGRVLLLRSRIVPISYVRPSQSCYLAHAADLDPRDDSAQGPNYNVSIWCAAVLAYGSWRGKKC